MLDKFIQSSDPRTDLIPTAPPVTGTFPGGSMNIFDLFSQLGSWAGIIGFLTVLWSIYAILAYIFAIILLVLYVYASVQKNLYIALQAQELRDAEKLYDELYRGSPRNSRLQDVYTHSDSDNPNDWKLAIIEADIILDDILKKRGYAGNSLGERLKSISPNQVTSLNDAWQAHKIRNRIAHDGADFVLTKRVVQETIAQYQRVFDEFGVT